MSRINKFSEMSRAIPQNVCQTTVKKLNQLVFASVKWTGLAASVHFIGDGQLRKHGTVCLTAIQLQPNAAIGFFLSDATRRGNRIGTTPFCSYADVVFCMLSVPLFGLS